MKKFILWLLKLLPHGCFILAFNIFVFFMLDRFNRAMVFLDNVHTKRLTVILCVLTLIESVVFFAMGTGVGKSKGQTGRNAASGQTVTVQTADNNRARAGLILKGVFSSITFFLALFLFEWWFIGKLFALVNRFLEFYKISLRLPPVGFLANGYSKWPLGVFCLLVVVQSVLYIVILRLPGAKSAEKPASGMRKPAARVK